MFFGDVYMCKLTAVQYSTAVYFFVPLFFRPARRQPGLGVTPTWMAEIVPLRITSPRARRSDSALGASSVDPDLLSQAHSEPLRSRFRGVLVVFQNAYSNA